MQAEAEDGWGSGGKAELELTWQLISAASIQLLLCTHTYKRCTDPLYLHIHLYSFLGGNWE